MAVCHSTIGRILLITAWAAILCACLVHAPVEVNPALLNARGHVGKHKLQGRVLILSNKDEDQPVISAKPENLVFGSATRVDISFEKLMADAAAAAFGEIFADGAVLSNGRQATVDDLYVVKSQVESFSYRYKNTWSGPLVADIEMSIAVSIATPAGDVVSERKYQSGRFMTEPVHNEIGDDIAEAVHVQIRDLMVQAALDFVDETLLGAR